MTTSTYFYHSAGRKITVTEHRLRTPDSDSDSDDESMSIINSRHWKSAISTAKKANDSFNLYPWDDNPADLDGNEATRRVAWLAEQEGYPFMELHQINDGYVYTPSPSTSIQLLYLCHKVKNNEPFNERDFYNQLGEVRKLLAKVECEGCCCILF